MQGLRGLVNRCHHAFVSLGSGYGEDVGIGGPDRLGLGAHAAGDDHLAVLGHGFTDRSQRLLFGAVEETASVDHNGVRPSMGFGQFVAFSAEPGDDPFAVDQGFRTTERHEGDAWRRARAHGSGQDIRSIKHREALP